LGIKRSGGNAGIAVHQQLNGSDGSARLPQSNARPQRGQRALAAAEGAARVVEEVAERVMTRQSNNQATIETESNQADKCMMPRLAGLAAQPPENHRPMTFG
jgi:hypothetical protein